MSLTMSSATLPVLTRMLHNAELWLDKAQAHADAKKFDGTVYLGMRLAPDMLPFTRQIQIATDTAKFLVARLAGDESAPKFEDDEATLAALKARLRRTIEYVESVPAAKLDGTEEREITIPMRAGPLTMRGEDYLRFFALPNFYFHLTTTYALLRHAGVELGKPDFLGAMKG